MRYLLFFLMFSICCEGNSQTTDSIINYNCNDKWLDELVKTDSISKEYRNQNYLCYKGIFDSLENSKLYSKSQMLHAIGNFEKYIDGTLSEIYFYMAFEYVFNHTEIFFQEMKSEPEKDIKVWAKMVYNEYAQRSASEINFSKYIIEELEANLKTKKLKSWILFQKVLKEVDREHQKMFEDYYKK